MTPMRLERPHHAILDVLADAEGPLTTVEIARRVPDDIAASTVRMRVRFLETHGYVRRHDDNGKAYYERAPRSRA